MYRSQIQEGPSHMEHKMIWSTRDSEDWACRTIKSQTQTQLTARAK
jgi:hypothetical protein